MTESLDLDSRRILDERARRLATPPRDQAERDGLVAAVFEVGGAHYGVDVARVREVLRPGPMAQLPDLGGALVAIRAVRGEILPLADTGRLLAGDATAEARASALVLDGESPVGLLVNDEVALMTLDQDDMHATASRSPLIAAVTGSGVALLAVDALLVDSRLAVAEQSGGVPDQAPEELAQEGRGQR